MKLSEVIDIFIEDQYILGNTEKTIHHNKTHLYFFIKWCTDIDIKELTFETYKNYIIYLRNKKTKYNKPLASRTIFTYAEILKHFIHFCEKRGYIVDSIYEKIQLPRYKKKVIRILNENEIKAILTFFDDSTFIGARNNLIISLMLDCGLRLSEVTNLKFTDFQIERKLILVNGKGQKQRFVPFSSATYNYFQKYMSFFENKFVPTQQFFVDIVGFPITNEAIKSFLQRIRKKLSIQDLHPHLLRHTFATMYILNGGDPLNLQIILGHTTLTMTQHYVHLAAQMRIAEQMQYSPLSNISLVDTSRNLSCRN